jgi:hypothetical protein
MSRRYALCCPPGRSPAGGIRWPSEARLPSEAEGTWGPNVRGARDKNSGGSRATRDGWAWAHGRQYGPAVDARRSHVCRLRRQRRRGEGLGSRGSDRCANPRRLRGKACRPEGGVGNGACWLHGRHREQDRRAHVPGGHNYRWRQFLLPRRYCSCRQAQRAGHPFCRRGHERRRVRPREGVLPHDRRGKGNSRPALPVAPGVLRAPNKAFSIAGKREPATS